MQARQTALITRDRVICALLDKLGRCRPLDREESRLLDATLHRLAPKRAGWHWTEAEDDAICALLRRRLRQQAALRRWRGYSYQPFVEGSEVRDLAARLGRSYMAVHRRMERLRKGHVMRDGKPVKLFKRMGGHAALEARHGSHAPPFDDCSQSDPSRGNGSRTAGRVEGHRRIEEGSRSQAESA